jgi:hypothetical protein
MSDASARGRRSRRTGNEWERDLVKWLNRRGYAAITSRNARGGSQQGVDIITDLPVSVEAKRCKAFDLAGWVDQAREQADESAPGAVFVHRRGRADPGEGYVVMQANDFVDLVADLSSRPLDDKAVPF